MIGATVGSYQIVAPIGEGGMGMVYRGHHAILGRPAAIKVLRPELSQRREIVARFFNEARAATASRHPGIVEIYDFGFLPDGAAYIAMEFLEGESLASRVRRERRMPMFATIQIGRQIAAALHAAHSKGITHRDLKPDNVFLVPDPEIGERVKLLDFGIAKLAAGDASGGGTQHGEVMGTPAYMSPEQCRDSSALDQRSDLYSLGCMLYELLAGRPLFPAGSAGDIIAHHLYFQPEPLRVHDPSLPAPLEQLIMALLAKDPAQRPATAGVVVEVLDQWRAWNVPPSPGAARAASIAALPMPQPGRISGPIQTTLSGAAASVASPPAGTPGARSRRAIWLAAIPVLAAAGVGAAIVMARPRAPDVRPPAVVQAAAAPPTVAPPPSAAAGSVVAAPPPPAAAAEPAGAASPPAGAAAAAASPPAGAASPPAAAAAASPPAGGASPPAAAASPPAGAASPPAGAASPPAAAASPPAGAASPPPAAAADSVVEVSAPHKKRPPGSKRAKAPTPSRAGAEQPAAPELAAAAAPAEDAPPVAPAPPTAPIAAEPAPRPAAATPPPAPIKAGSLDAVSSIASVSVDGPLPDSEIRSTVERALGAFRECYRSAARQAGKTPAFRITLSFVVDEGRAARSVQVRGDALGIAACVKDAASRIRTRVAPDVGTAAVQVVVKFQPTDG